MCSERGGFAHWPDVTKGGRLLRVTLARWVATTLASTAIDATIVAAPMCSPSSSADHASVSSGWISWTWPIFATPPRASAGVPGEEADQGADHARRRRTRATRRRSRGDPPADRGDRADRDGQRRRQEHRPADHPPAAHARARARRPRRSRSRPARPRTQDLHVAAAHAGALRRREREHGDEPGEARHPEARARGARPRAATATTAVAAGQQPDDHRAVRGGQAAERERGEQGPAEHHAGRDDREPSSWGRGGQRRSRGAAGSRRPGTAATASRPMPDEGRVELLDRHARGRQREAEGEHAEEAEEDRHAGVTLRAVATARAA